MLSGLFTLPVFAADEEAVVNAELSELLFIGSDGSAIGDIPDAKVKARATVTTDGAETVSLYVAAYNADGTLKSLDSASEVFTGASTKILSTPIGADAKGASRVSAFVWKSGLSPVVERVDLGSQAILLNASVTVPDYNYNSATAGDYTFDAVVNNESKNVTFYIPYTTYSNEINAYGVMSYPGVTPNVDAVTYSLDTVGTASLAENTPTDADKITSVTITSPDGTNTATYTVEHKFVAVERRINDFASAKVDGTKLTYSTTDVLDGNVYLNDQHIAIPSGKVSVDSSKEKINFDLGNNNMNFRASQISSKDTCQYNDHFVMNFEFCIDSFTAVTDGTNRFAYTEISNVDELVFVATGENTFVINHRKSDNSGTGTRFENCPELETGKWYTYTHVFDKDPSYTNGYKVSGYINGKYIGSCADAAEAPEATFDRSTGNDFILAAFGTSTIKGSFREFELMSVMGDEKYEGKTTVHILGDSIARFYSSKTDETSQEGWGYALSKAFDSSKVRVLNHSVGGYNSNIYLNGANRNDLKSEPIWQSIERYIKSGDYVLIAIGRNETNSTDGTKTTAKFVENLTTMADKVKAAGAVPVFVTAIPAVSIEDDVYSVDNSINFSGQIKAAYDMRNFAAENGYACLDLNAESYHELMDMTSDELKTIFLSDKVHITEKGADLLSELLVKLIAENKTCDLKDYLAQSYDANHAYVKSATAVIGGTTYTADVNTDSNTITFEQALLPIKAGGVDGEYAVASNATVEIIANGTVSGIGETVDLSTPKTITVTQGTDVQTYTLQFDKAQYVRTYNADGNQNDTGSASTVALRKFILKADNASGNIGFGGWFA